MIDLSKTFLQCKHCGHNFAEPRHVCPACDWPRSHSEKTPPPTWSQPDPNAVSTAPAPQVHGHVVGAPLEAPVQLEMTLAAPDQPAPVPQAVGGTLDLSGVQPRPASPRTLQLAAEDEQS